MSNYSGHRITYNTPLSTWIENTVAPSPAQIPGPSTQKASKGVRQIYIDIDIYIKALKI